MTSSVAVTGWSAAPPLDDNRQPYFLRGAKIPDLAGLVRPCEIARGRINHALAFAYPGTTSNRLQLDPSNLRIVPPARRTLRP
jgi:hypothetical protein